MYRVKNVALDPYLKKYNVRSLNEFTNDDLQKLVRDEKDLNAKAIFRKSRESEDMYSRNKTRGEFDRSATLRSIVNALTYSDYMGIEYWNEEQLEKARELYLLEDAQNFTRGEQTFKAYADASFGFYQLRPGEEVELDVNSSWVEEVLKQKPAAKNLKIENLDEPQERSEKAEQDQAKMIESMNIRELQELAKQYDLPIRGTKQDLKERISKVL